MRDTGMHGFLVHTGTCADPAVCRKHYLSLQELGVEDVSTTAARKQASLHAYP